jgi:2-iminobutanoate/2-iminopropanoate deaminase
MARRQAFNAQAAPKPNGHYSHCVKSTPTNGFLHMCGFMGDDPASGTIVEGGLEAQTEQAMKNVKAVLDAAGSDFERVVRRRIFIVNMTPQAVKAVDGITANWFKEPYPVSVRSFEQTFAPVSECVLCC